MRTTVIRRKIPTYEPGKPEIHPLFFEKRVYQGSSGKVYPVPFIDRVSDHKTDKEYLVVILENECISLELLPEIGGRIFRARDKSNGGYDFFYRQEVIKPALVGLAGPWISGGVEFNWPQHHRPGTYLPCDFHVEQEKDGSRTVWMSETDPISRMKGMHGIRLRPGSALIELRGRLYNGTPFMQTFLWWANVAVRVHKNYESFFPPDVHYVADHAVRAMTGFPLADGYYYGIPYHLRPGSNDLRRYTHIPVPTSFMVCETGYDFFGGYDHDAEGGFIHVANRHIAPGKKQWTWGSEEFGRAWDRELTDTGGPYLELMAGVYTDNQPDFTYLAPFETKTFSQYWWPYRKLGPVHQAGKDLALRFETLQDGRLELGVASSRSMEGLQVIIEVGKMTRTLKDIKVSPSHPWLNRTIRLEPGSTAQVSVHITDRSGRRLLTFRNPGKPGKRNRSLAKEPPAPGQIEHPSALELVGEHLEQYRHPTRAPEPYWEEAIRKDPSQYQAMISLGRSLLKRGLLAEAEMKLRRAVAILTTHHPNPRTGEAHYYCGLCCLIRNKTEEAYALLYKATWDQSWSAPAYYLLATIDARNGDNVTAMEHLESALDYNGRNNRARIMQSILLRKNGEQTAARRVLKELLQVDPLDQWARFERALHTRKEAEFMRDICNNAQTVIDIAFHYSEAGFFAEAIRLIELHHTSGHSSCVVPDPLRRSPTTWFLLSWLHGQLGAKKESELTLKQASRQDPDYFFPSRIQEQLLLQWAIERETPPAIAGYGLGNYFMDRKRYEEAIGCWEMAAAGGMGYAPLFRNLGMASWNHRKDARAARSYFEKAITASPGDMRIAYEYDQLKKQLNDPPEERLASLEKYGDLIHSRDDLRVELASLYNFAGRHHQALDVLERKPFHPWEGGEGLVLKQYTQACLKLGASKLREGDASSALAFMERAGNTPDHLGEKYHPLQAKAHIYYWKGMALKHSGDEAGAKRCFSQSARQEGDFIEMEVSAHSEMTWYRALSLLELGEHTAAERLLMELREYALKKLAGEAKIDYFATSLPLMLVFEEDLQKRNQWESKYLLALAEAGLGHIKEAKILAREVLQLNAMHTGALNLMMECDKAL